ncbi:hypothetical protein [Nocardia bovistercoris]|uniref:Uncharacterized protein n=1 Tax=Nocardia bovistercoris TaxID=2785916 RepID=A0A931I9G6_9NOCA|nr:hypothetical protein [Nocardia bovistercoris]MBH0776801.1 hypothetical protein [Nocardia bovistercoris]
MNVHTTTPRTETPNRSATPRREEVAECFGTARSGRGILIAWIVLVIAASLLVVLL